MHAHSIKQKEDLEADKVIAFEGEQVTTSTSFWYRMVKHCCGTRPAVRRHHSAPRQTGDSQYAANQASLLTELPATI